MSAGAAIFFARNFLAQEYPKFALHALADRPRVYIAVNSREVATIASEDPAGEIEVIGESPLDHDPTDDGNAVNIDRSLRFCAADEIRGVRRAVAGVTARILARHPRPSFYFDEPVSGYANEVFNSRFTQAGALCLHFQTAWVPGFGFFTRDKAQSEPVELNLCDNGDQLATDHVARRDAGAGLPLYMMGYGRYSKRAKDLGITLGKAAWRATARRNANYIDRDPEAHWLHARSLMKSFAGGYGIDPIVRADPERTIVFPLHYEPEAVLLYYSRFPRQEEIAARLLDTLPPDWSLVIKEHPSQPGALRLPKWRDLVRAARVIPLAGTYPGARLLAARPLVVSIGSTFSLEAAFAGCRTGLLGNVHFADAPGIARLAAPEDWPSALRGPGPDRGGMTEWYGRFMQRYAFSGNFQQGKTWVEQPAALIAALQNAAASQGLNP